MKKIENIREALDVLNEMTAFGASNWYLSGVIGGLVLYSDDCDLAFEEDPAVMNANNLSGYYTALEAERDAMRQELRSRAEAIVALTAEIERLRPVAEAVKAEYALRAAQQDHLDTPWEDSVLEDERMCAAILEVQSQLRILLNKEKESA